MPRSSSRSRTRQKPSPRPAGPAGVSAQDAVSITVFTPVMPDAYWSVIGEFVRAAVTDAAPQVSYSARTLLTTSAAYVLWCWQTASVPLTREVVFSRSVIEGFVARGCPSVSAGSRGNRRSQLLRMAEVLLGTGPTIARLNPLDAAPPLAPYSQAQLMAMRSWAAGQPTVKRQRDCATVLALGAGCGLAPQDIAWLTADMVAISADGVVVTVPGRRARRVAVLAEWEEPIRAAVAAARAAKDPTRLLFGEGRHSRHTNYMSGFLAKTTGVDIVPQAQRLRATWIVHHLRAGTPLGVLVTAAGVKGLESFARYLPFVPPLTDEVACRVLRNARTDTFEGNLGAGSNGSGQ